jgi:hypothetical protein
MAVKKNSARQNQGKDRNAVDRSKEDVIKNLVAALTERGLTVRREELKRGPGWKAVSGVCRVADQRVIFLDRTTTADEQIEFLVGRFRQFSVPVSPERLSQLPESVQHLLSGQPVEPLAA